MKYQTQKIAYWYFLTAMILFAVQVTMGLVLGSPGAAQSSSTRSPDCAES